MNLYNNNENGPLPQVHVERNSQMFCRINGILRLVNIHIILEYYFQQKKLMYLNFLLCTKESHRFYTLQSQIASPENLASANYNFHLNLF